MLHAHLARRATLLSCLSLAASTLADAQIQFDPASPIVSSAPNNAVVVVGDYDGDGRPDVLTGASAPTGQRWYRNQGLLGFDGGTPLPVVGDYDRTFAGASGDVDADGDVDLVLAQEDYEPSLGISYALVLFRNDGSGSFTHTTLAYPDLPSGVLLVDLDGDSLLDLLYTDDDGVHWRSNNGAGSFNFPASSITNALVRPRRPHAADLNGDGLLDVIACSYDDQVVWMANLGGGSFGVPQAITTVHLNPYSVHGDDVDGDGDADVLVGSLHESTPISEPQIDGIVAWYENLDGAGTFGPQQVLLSEFPGGTSDAQLVDLDADGRNDAVWSAFNELRWRRNTGGGNFAPMTAAALSGFSATRIAAADLDDDHRLDVLVALSNSGLVDALRQQPGAAASSFCDGPQLGCPCANPGGNVEGCVNSTGAGAYLSWAGSASLAVDDLVLHAFQGPPNQPGILAQGSLQTLAPISDGLLCIASSTHRLKVVFLDGAGTATVSESLGSLSVGVSPGSTRHYQLWYRDPIGGSCGSGSNLTNAITVTWQ